MESVYWLVVLVLAVFFLRHEIGLYLDLQQVRTTSVSLRDIEDVPFPGIVIDASRDLDPLRLVRASADMVQEADIGKERGNNNFLAHKA